MLCTLAVLLQNCIATSRDNGLLLIDKKNLDEVETGQFSELYKEVRIIPLEATEQSLFAEVRQTITTGSAIFILAKFSDKSFDTAVWQYDTNGKLIQQIGSIGEGPGEYLRISNMALRDDSLFLFDDATQKVLLFDAVSGKHLANLHTEGFEPLADVNTVLPIPGSTNFLLSSNVTDSGDADNLYELAEYNPWTEYFKVILPQKFVVEWSSYEFAYPSFSNLDDKMALAVLPLNDTIYSVEYSTTQIQPFAKLCIGAAAPTFQMGEEYEKALERAEARDYYLNRICKIYASKDYLILNLYVGSVVWNLSAKRGWYTLNGYKSGSGFPFFPMDIVESHRDNTFVCTFDIDFFTNRIMPEVRNNSVIKTTGDLSNINPDNSNGVLVIYKLK